MAGVWVKAKSIVRISENGQIKTFHPGDWCLMGKQQARDCLTRNEVEILKPAVLQSVQDLYDCAIFLKGELEEIQRGVLVATFPGVPVQQYESYPNYGRFLIWDTGANLRRELILTGFKLLEKWQIAVPLCNYNMLASDIGTPKVRKETEAIIHDLRVPVYDSRVIFARRCSETKKLFEQWQNGSQLEFLQALYQSRPVVNALPPSWLIN